MKQYDFNDIELTGCQYHRLKQRCVYGWFRSNPKLHIKQYCIYIGQGSGGMERVLGNHHIINKIEPVQPSDGFKFLWLDSKAPFDALDYIEQLLIKKYRPVYNIVHNKERVPYERPKTSPMQKVPEPIRAKTELAKVLQCPVSQQLLLGNSQDSTIVDGGTGKVRATTTKPLKELSTEELEAQLAQINIASIALKKASKY